MKNSKAKIPLYILLFITVALSLDVNLVVINDYKNILYIIILFNLFYVLVKHRLKYISIYKKKYFNILVVLILYISIGTIINKLNNYESSYLPFIINAFVLVTILALDSSSVIKSLNITSNKIFYFILLINLPIFYVGLVRGSNTGLNIDIHGSVPFLIPLLIIIPLLQWDIKKIILGFVVNLFFVYYIPKTTNIILYFVDVLILIGLFTNVIKYFKTLVIGISTLLIFSFSFFLNEIIDFSIKFRRLPGFVRQQHFSFILVESSN